METKTVTQTVSLSRHYEEGIVKYRLEIKLTWINGQFDNMRLQQYEDDPLLMSVQSNEILRFSANGVIAFRELMQEVVTTTNNPPVGCEPV